MLVLVMLSLTLRESGAGKSRIKSESVQVEEQETEFSFDNISILGSTVINGVDYDAECVCRKPTPQEQIPPIQQNAQVEPSVCNPTEVKIKLDAQGQGASDKDIRNLLGPISELKFTRIAETGFKTLDGRVKGTYLATPGGDAGEFILALQIYSEMLGQNVSLTENNVLRIFAEYLQYMRQEKFYMATDDIATAHIEKELGIIGLNISRPRSQYQEDVLSIVAEPENVGDLHIKLLLSESSNYSVNKTLVQYFLQAFYVLLWDSSDNSLADKLYLDILIGDHNESAFVEVKTDIECLRNNRAPLLRSSQNTLSVFVNDIDAVSLLRADLAKFFTQRLSGQEEVVDTVKTETMFNRMNHLGLAYLELTGSYSAKYLPFYTVSFV